MFGLSKRERDESVREAIRTHLEGLAQGWTKDIVRHECMMSALLMLRSPELVTEKQARDMAERIRNTWYSVYWTFGMVSGDGWRIPAAAKVYDDLLALAKYAHRREVEEEAKALGICKGRKK